MRAATTFGTVRIRGQPTGACPMPFPLAGAVLTLFRVVLKVIAEGEALVVGDVLP